MTDNKPSITRRKALQGSAIAVSSLYGIERLTKTVAAQSGGPTDEISGIVENDSGPVENATVVVVPHDESLSQLITTTDQNGEYIFDSMALHGGENLYHVIARNGTEQTPIRGEQNYPFIAAEGVAIPDSVVDQLIHAYYPSDFSTSNWPDDIGASDIDTINGPTFDETGFGGDGGVVGGGTDDSASSDSMGPFGSNMDTDFAVAIGFSTTQSDDGFWISAGNTNDDTSFFFRTGGADIGVGHFGVRVRDASSNDVRVETPSAVNDGGERVLLFNKTGNSPSGSSENDSEDVFQIYNDDPTTNVARIASTDAADTISNPSDFNTEVTYYGYWDGGFNLSTSINRIFWFNDSLDQNQRDDVFNELYPWWSQ